MASFKLPPILEVEEEDEYDPDGQYGEPVKKTIIIKFGEYEVARYFLEKERYSDCFYYEDDKGGLVLYDEPAEFVAYKLRKLFALIG